MLNDNNKIVRIALCKEGSEQYGLTVGQFYTVQCQHEDLIDGDVYMFVCNDHGDSVNVKANRFGGIINIRQDLFAELNK